MISMTVHIISNIPIEQVNENWWKVHILHHIEKVTGVGKTVAIEVVHVEEVTECIR